jgi:hypothetical protein
MLLLAVALGCIPASCVQGEGPPRGILRGASESMVHLTFTRSGGAVAAPGMTVEASVAFGAAGAELTVTGDEYRRHLTAAEIAQLLKDVDVARFFQLRADLRASSPAGFDQYQYDISLETRDGKKHSVTIGGSQSPDELNAFAPGLGRLFGWIQRETDAIWQARVSRR